MAKIGRPSLLTPKTKRDLLEAIAGEREALSMQFHDHNVAIGTVQQLGFLVQRPEDGSVEVKAEYVN